MAKIEVPDEVKKKAETEGLDWSSLVSRMIKSLEEEKEAVDWSVKLQRSSRKGRYEELKKKGLV